MDSYFSNLLTAYANRQILMYADRSSTTESDFDSETFFEADPDIRNSDGNSSARLSVRLKTGKVSSEAKCAPPTYMGKVLSSVTPSVRHQISNVGIECRSRSDWCRNPSTNQIAIYM